MENKYISTLLVGLAFIFSFYFYPAMHDIIAVHWNMGGSADGYAPRLWLFFIPLIMLCAMVFLYTLPKLDPLRDNVVKFRVYYENFIVVFLLFLFYLHVIIILWNRGVKFDFRIAIMPAFSALFYYTGVLVENTKRNWFIGIRTPWTISSDLVWERTHKLGGRLFKLASLFVLLGLFFEWGLLFVVLLIFSIAAITVIYSYVEYKRGEDNAGDGI